MPSSSQQSPVPSVSFNQLFPLDAEQGDEQPASEVPPEEAPEEPFEEAPEEPFEEPEEEQSEEPEEEEPSEEPEEEPSEEPEEEQSEEPEEEPSAEEKPEEELSAIDSSSNQRSTSSPESQQSLINKNTNCISMIDIRGKRRLTFLMQEIPDIATVTTTTTNESSFVAQCGKNILSLTNESDDEYESTPLKFPQTISAFASQATMDEQVVDQLITINDEMSKLSGGDDDVECETNVTSSMDSKELLIWFNAVRKSFSIGGTVVSVSRSGVKFLRKIMCKEASKIPFVYNTQHKMWI